MFTRVEEMKLFAVCIMQDKTVMRETNSKGSAQGLKEYRSEIGGNILTSMLATQAGD